MSKRMLVCFTGSAGYLKQLSEGEITEKEIDEAFAEEVAREMRMENAVEMRQEMREHDERWDSVNKEWLK